MPLLELAMLATDKEFAAALKKGVRVIINIGTSKNPEYYSGKVDVLKRNGYIKVNFDDGDTGMFKPTRSLVGLVGLAKKGSTKEILAKDVNKFLVTPLGKGGRTPGSSSETIKPKGKAKPADLRGDLGYDLLRLFDFIADYKYDIKNLKGLKDSGALAKFDVITKYYSDQYTEMVNILEGREHSYKMYAKQSIGDDVKYYNNLSKNMTILLSRLQKSVKASVTLARDEFKLHMVELFDLMEEYEGNAKGLNSLKESGALDFFNTIKDKFPADQIKDRIEKYIKSCKIFAKQADNKEEKGFYNNLANSFKLLTAQLD